MLRKIPIFLIIFFIACKPADVPTFEDVVIIGGGLMGSSAAWHLSKNGEKVLVLEMQDSIYTQGSSFGEARIARSNNRGNDMWSYLHNQSVSETKELIRYLNSTVEDNPFSISDIYTSSPVTYVGRTRIYDKLYASLIRQKVDYEMATSVEEGRTKFQVNLPDSVLIQREYNEHSGTMNPKILIQYLHEAVRKKTNSVQYNTRVTNLVYNESTSLFEISTNNLKTSKKETIHAKKVVTAAGPYTGKLLNNIAPNFNKEINPQRVFLAYYQINKEKYNSLSKAEHEKIKNYYPVINSSKGTRDGSFFSMIEYYNEDQHPVIKIGGHFQRSDIQDLDKVWSQDLSNKELEWSRTNTANYMALLNVPVEEKDLEYVNGYSCVYSLTQTEVPFVTAITQNNLFPENHFVVLGGMSGVGAKGAMTYGKIGSDIMLEKTHSDTMYLHARKALGFGRLEK